MRPADLAISTCNRSPQYIHRTLESLFARDSQAQKRGVRLVVSGIDTTYLERWSQPYVRVEPFEEAEWRDVSKQDGKRKVAINFLRCLAGNDDTPLIAMQDDIVFADHWLWHAEEIADRIHKSHTEPFIVALYASYRFKTKPFAPYNPFNFYGNQALYISPTARRHLRALFESAREAGALRPDDMMVKDFVLHSATKLFAANPNLCQHVGERSAIEERFHRSPSFQPLGHHT